MATRDATQGGMRHEDHIRVFPHQSVERRDADHHRRHQRTANAVIGRDTQLSPQLVEVARQTWKVTIDCPQRSQSSGRGLDPSGEGGNLLIGQTVVVLDEIDAAFGQATGEVAQRVGRQDLRLECGRGQGAPMGTQSGADPIHAVPGSSERPTKLFRQFQIDELDVAQDRRIAEQHVHQLPGFEARGLDRQPHPNQVVSAASRVDLLDLPDDHTRVGDRLDGHLDALLDGERTGTRVDRRRRRSNAVDGSEARSRRHRSGTGQGATNLYTQPSPLVTR